jgi:hypothetical protein
MIDYTAYCKVSISPVRAEPTDTGEIVTQLLFGEVVDILEQTEKWFKIRTYYDNYVGWIDPKQIQKLTKKEVGRWLDGLSIQNELFVELVTPWGKQLIFKGSFLPYGVKDSFLIGNDEFFITNRSEAQLDIAPTDIAINYLNAPYLWGGKTPFGIDCSGLTQMVFRFLDINLPRDASQQAEYGNRIEFSERLPGDVFFFKNENDKIIHVGIIKDENKIIHASGQVKIDPYDNKGILHQSGEYYTHYLAEIRRMI